MSTAQKPAYWLDANLSTAQKIRDFEQIPLSERGLPNSVYELLKNSCLHDPDADALVYFSDPKQCQQTQTVWCFSTLLSRVGQFGNLLRTCGVTQDTAVSLLLANTPDCLVAFLGTQSVAVANPVNWMLEPAAIADVLRRAQSKVLCAYVGDERLSFWDKIPQIIALYPQLETVICLDEFGAAEYLDVAGRPLPQGVQCISYVDSIGDYAGELALDTLPRGHDLAALFPTSGTTGAPKLIPHTQEMVVHSAWLSALAVGMQEGDSRLSATPLFHVVGVYSGCLATLARGARVIFPTAAGWRHPELIPNLWQVVELLSVNYLSVVPTILNQLVHLPVDRAALHSVKGIMSGSAPLSHAIAQRFQQLTGLQVREGYGLTETTSAVMMNPAHGKIKVGSSGLLFPYHRARLEPSGELVISGPQVAAEPLYTGDLARIDEDGYLWIVGRLKDVIIRGGHNIDPKMVEDVFYQHPKVLDAVVVGQPDAYAGEIPVAYVQLEHGVSVDAQELMGFVAAHALERAAIPKYCRIVTAIPQSSVGKILRQEVQLWAIRDGVMSYIQPVLESCAGEAQATVLGSPAGDSEATAGVAVGSEVELRVQRHPTGAVDIEIQHGPTVCPQALEQAVAQLALDVRIRAKK